MIITTAIPQITDEFHSVTDIGWYGSAYLLTQCASQLLFGKLYTFFSVKGTFLTSLFLFEVGSAICGAAPNSVSFIIGRAIAGLGAAGILSGVVSLESDIPESNLGLISNSPGRHHRARRPASQTSHVSRLLRCHLRRLFRCRASTWRRLHLKGHLEMVLLHQPPLRRLGRHHHLFDPCHS